MANYRKPKTAFNCLCETPSEIAEQDLQLSTMPAEALYHLMCRTVHTRTFVIRYGLFDAVLADVLPLWDDLWHDPSVRQWLTTCHQSWAGAVSYRRFLQLTGYVMAHVHSYHTLQKREMAVHLTCRCLDVVPFNPFRQSLATLIKNLSLPIDTRCGAGRAIAEIVSYYCNC